MSNDKTGQKDQKPPHKHKLLQNVSSTYRAFRTATTVLYTPLSSARSFRILSLRPGTGNDLIKCSLQVASLASPPFPLYETISYCWGDPRPFLEIEIDGVRRTMPASSVEALKRVRLPDRPRILWIDAVCTDQSSLEERAQQVLLMKDIFSCSVGNVVYLGKEEDFVPAAMNSISLLLDEIKQETNGFRDFASTVFGLTRGVERHAGTAVSAQVDVVALEKFYSIAWFRRVWVCQEALLAPSNNCLCGSYSLPLLDILRVSVWLRYKSEHMPILCNTVSSRIQEWWRKLDSQCSDQSRATLQDIFELFRFCQTRETTDPRDRVYGLLGLLEGPIPRQLLPDYTRPQLDVLCDATRLCFLDATQSNLCCEVLASVNHRHQFEVDAVIRPSWMPNWELFQDYPGPFRTIFAANGEGLGGSIRFEGETESAFWDLTHPHELVLRGFIVDKIAALSSVLDGTISSNAAKLQKWLDSLPQLVAGSAKKTVPVEEDDVLAHTLVGGVNWRAELSDEHELKEESAAYFACVRSGMIPPHVWMTSSSGDRVAARRYDRAMACASRERQIFRTEGESVGSAPAMAVPRDLIVVLYGSMLPVVLRQMKSGTGTYRFVGMAYVHGIMFGEAAQAHRAEQGEDIVFRIR